MKIMRLMSVALFICGSMSAESVLERYFHHRMPANAGDMQAGQIIFYFSGTLAKPNPVLSEETCELLNAHECIKKVSSVHMADVKATKQMIDQFNNEFDNILHSSKKLFFNYKS